ncbi:hypothetical protein BS50DRAFT_574444 [Corynespora cassiicola Philippines]|uniref:Rhodopsin domain-containing protein n=1 Tax=Corynespora cassiicola Philippines TaxID=1448308 RepID=A0A2T2NKJ8_CORCC|nr:hypothetical protein BS50DRAFT_574444 [Corynespora cassiicola Philippines]
MDVPDPIHEDRYVPPPQVAVAIGWLATSIAVVATGVRFGTKLSMRRMVNVDDFLIVGSVVFAFGQMIACFLSAKLATDKLPSGAEWNSFQKAYHSSQLLFVPSICLAKCSVLYSLHIIMPCPEEKLPIACAIFFVSLLLVAFEFCVAFQCSAPQWNIFTGKCFDQIAFWQAFGIIDIVTDAFIVVFPIYIVAALQMRAKVKILVAGVFSARIFAIAVSIVRIIFVTKSYGTPLHSENDFWTYVILTEIEQGLSVTTACIPFLKPFFESLETGMMASNHGLQTVTCAPSGSGLNSNPSHQEKKSLELCVLGQCMEINVSRRISMHSEERELIGEATAWAKRPEASNHR